MRIKRSIPALLIFLGLGSIFAEKVASSREFNGKIEVQILSKRKNTGRWEQLDRLIVPNSQFTCQFGSMDFSNNIQIDTKYDFVGITDQGTRILVRMKEPATAHFNPTNGTATLDMNLKVEGNGVTTQVPIKLTTEVSTTPSGPEHGRRAARDSMGTISIALVGGGMITTKMALDPNSMLGQENIKALVEILVLVRGDGLLSPASKD
jgi:hypothetical protein